MVEYVFMNEVILCGRRILLTYFKDVPLSKVDTYLHKALKHLEVNP